MPNDNSVDGDIDGHSSDEDRNAVEVVFDPSNPYRRKSSLVSSETVPPRLRKSTVAPPSNDKAHCVVHHFLEAQRLGGHPGGGGGGDESSHHHHHFGRKSHLLHPHHQPSHIRQIDEAVEESRDGKEGKQGKAIDASEERGLNRIVEPKGSSSTHNFSNSNNSSSSYLPRDSSHADVARLRNQSVVVEAATSDSDAGQVDEKEWAQGIVTGEVPGLPERKKKQAVKGGDDDDEKVEVSAENSPDKDSTASTDVPEPMDILHSRLLTKKQLSEMAWGVRELSRRLGSLRLKFRVKTIFLLTKIYDEDLLPKARALTKWLLSHERDVRYTVYLERSLKANKVFDMPGLLDELRKEETAAVNTTDNGNSPPPPSSSAADLASRLRFWDEPMCRARPHTFDFVITLGGDGTVLYASWLFQRIVPPVLSFSLGSLGFLTKFDFDDYQATLTRAFAQGVTVSLRLRFEATIMRSQTVEKAVLTDTGDSSASAAEAPKRKRDLVEQLIGEEKDDEHTHRPDGTFEILNEVVVDRGPNASEFFFLLISSSFQRLPLTTSHVLHGNLWGRRALYVCAGRRHLRVDADGVDGVQSGRRWLALPSGEPGDAGDVHLPAHAVVPADHPARHHCAARRRAVRCTHELVGQLRRPGARRAAPGRLRDDQCEPVPVCVGPGARPAKRGLGQQHQRQAGVEHAAKAKGVQGVGQIGCRGNIYKYI